jgi:hypothetical protein
MKRLSSLLAVLAIASAPVVSRAQESDARETFEISPVILDVQDGQGSTIGLEFTFRDKKVLREYLPKEEPGEPVNPDAPIRYVSLAYDVSGTAAADEERNPKNFVNGTVDMQYLWSGAKTGALSGGAFLKYEADQSFDDQQSVYGLRVTYGKRNLIRTNDFIGIDLNRGQVDPSGDKSREAALGTTTLSKYYRNELELLYMFPLSEVLPFLNKAVEGFEFNYRYFHEGGAPAAVEAAGLDSFFLKTVRLRLPKQLFIAYSSGKLPFDLEDDEFFELGFSYKLME